VATDREQRILGIIETARAKRPKFRDERITMAHGAGGKATAALIEGVLVPAFASPALDELADAGAVEVEATQLAMTTDSFVVKPIRFPGGSIGELAVNGTVNDLAVAGARPVAISLALILEEGLEADVLRAEVEAIAAAARAADVQIVTGDTKVVERGHADQMYICTTGLGHRDPRARLSPAALRPGDKVLVSGRIGDHGTAIMLARGEFDLGATIESDTRPLWPAVDALLGVGTRSTRRALPARRDPRRRGLGPQRAGARLGVAMIVREAAVPVHPMVAGAAEILGIDPMHVANEGVLVAIVDPEHADAALRRCARLRAASRRPRSAR
jgi:hydrogenase expression/formation protein HypE